MARRSLAGLLVLLAGASLLPGDPGTGQPAPRPALDTSRLARFSAASVQVRGDTLVVAGLQDIPPQTAGRDLAGRVLVGADPGAELGLWTLKVAAGMVRATPFLGREGPGVTLLDPAVLQPPQPVFVPFKVPVAVTLTDLDAGGMPSRTRHVTVRTIRLSEERSRP
jgi:hypothetical protein